MTTTRTARTRTRRTGSEQPTATSEATGLAASFLAGVDDAVRDHLTASVTLRDFLDGAGALTLADRIRLVEQAEVLLEQNYVHLPLKTALHAVNPVQRLRLLRIRLERQTSTTMEPEHLFHAEMSEIFHSVRDLHTNYLLPAPFNGKVAYVPFLIEDYFDDHGERRYVVSHVVAGFTAPGFGPGVEVTHWSGIPIDRAVELNAARFAGSNAAARHARGLESLTIRPLVIHLPPYEQWVTVSYVDGEGDPRQLVQDWLVVDNLPPFVGDPNEVSSVAASQGLDMHSDEAGRAKKLLFAPSVAHATETDASSTLTTVPAAAGQDVPTSMPGVFRARSVETSSGTFGHLRIFTFSVEDPDAFVREFIRLIGLLPQDGLIVDVRDNGGGHIFASEFTLQTLTPRRITPEPTQFVSSPVNLAICRKHKDNPSGQIDLGNWFGSLDQATEIGAGFSAAFPITPVDGANAIGQRYHGPAVLITDARCYSATDIFAAGWADHEIGPILGIDDNTGAGGANVWTHGLLSTLLQFPSPEPDSPYKSLPNGANMRVSIRRTLRVGPGVAGTPVEDLGVAPDVRHHVTLDDVLHSNTDLLDRAGELLAALPARTLVVNADLRADGSLHLAVETGAIDRVDVYVDGRPRDSVDVADGGTEIVIADAAGAAAARVEGFAGGEVVASRTVSLDTESPAGTRTPGPVRASSTSGAQPTIVYVHGAGNKPPAEMLKRAWDNDLFHRDMGGQTIMAHYADLLHGRPGTIGADACSIDEALASLFSEASTEVVTAGQTPVLGDVSQFARTSEGRAFAARLEATITKRTDDPFAADDALTAALPLPRALRRILLRQLLRRLVPDAEAYFFTDRADALRERLRAALRSIDGTAIVVAHSLGTVIAYDVLREPDFAARDVRLLVTLGSPLGYAEVQDEITRPLQVPPPVQRWTNVADRRDVVALDGGLNNDFAGGMTLVDLRVDNPSPNNHAACGYLRADPVRTAVTAAVATAVNG